MSYQGKLRKSFVLLVFTICLSMLFASAAIAAPNGQGHGGKALTDPPPIEMQPFSAWNPNHQYLLDGENSIANLGNGSIKIDGYTLATQDVDYVGLTLTLQRWTGTSWVYAGSYNFQSPNIDIISAYSKYTVTKGYYYRCVSDHWTNEGGVYEAGSITGAFMLIN